MSDENSHIWLLWQAAFFQGRYQKRVDTENIYIFSKIWKIITSLFLFLNCRCNYLSFTCRGKHLLQKEDEEVVVIYPRWSTAHNTLYCVLLCILQGEPSLNGGGPGSSPRGAGWKNCQRGVQETPGVVAEYLHRVLQALRSEAEDFAESGWWAPSDFSGAAGCEVPHEVFHRHSAFTCSSQGGSFLFHNNRWNHFLVV